MSYNEHLSKYYIQVERFDEKDIQKEFLFVRHNHIWKGVIIRLIYIKDNLQYVMIRSKDGDESPSVISDEIKAFELSAIKQKITDIKVKLILNQINLPEDLIPKITKYIV